MPQKIIYPPRAVLAEGFGSLQNPPFVYDRMEYVLGVGQIDPDSAQQLNHARSFSLYKDPEEPDQIVGLEEGFAIAQLTQIGEKGRLGFQNEINSIPFIQGAFPVLRDRANLRHLIIPGEALIGFRNDVSSERAGDVMNLLNVRRERDIGANRFRVLMTDPQEFAEVLMRSREFAEIDFVDVSEVGVLNAESVPAAFKQVAEIRPFLKTAAGEPDPTVPSFTIAANYALLITGESEDAAEAQSFNESIGELVNNEEIQVVSSQEKLLTEALPGYLFVRLIDESEGANEEVIETLKSIEQVQEVFLGLRDSVDGLIRFADFQLVVVGLHGEPLQSDWQSFVDSYKLTIQYLDTSGRFAVLETDPTKLMPALLEEFRLDGRIRLAEPAYVADDSEAVQEALLAGVPTVGLWNHQTIRVEEAWVHSQGEDVVIAVVDGLAELSHELLAPSLLGNHPSLNFTNKNQVKAHGTHVMGICGGGLTGTQIIGLAPRAKILPLAVTTALGRYDDRAAALNALARFVRNKRWQTPDGTIDIPIARMVVNCSWTTTGDILIIRDAVQNVLEAGAMMCCSAGNANEDALGRHFPSDYPGVVCTAATDSGDHKLDVSNYGSRIDLSAPGGNGKPLDEGDILSLILNGAVGYLFGTSMASPHVAAIAAVVWSAAPDLAASDIVEILKSTATNIDHLQPANLAGKLGAGRIDAEVAIAKALTM